MEKLPIKHCVARVQISPIFHLSSHTRAAAVVGAGAAWLQAQRRRPPPACLLSLRVVGSLSHAPAADPVEGADPPRRGGGSTHRQHEAALHGHMSRACGAALPHTVWHRSVAAARRPVYT